MTRSQRLLVTSNDPGSKGHELNHLVGFFTGSRLFREDILLNAAVTCFFKTWLKPPCVTVRFSNLVIWVTSSRYHPN